MIWAIRDKVIEKIFIGYIELVYHTSEIEFDRTVLNKNLIRECILGFWHGDSYVMNLLMKRIFEERVNLKIVVTADRRGDFIATLVNAYGGRALRMPDGVKMKGFLKVLKEEARQKDSTIGIALDGPLGPLHEPKKIGFTLARDGEKALVGVKVDLSRKISLKKRWDNYHIPLPFTKIKFSAYNFGKIDGEYIKEFNAHKGAITETLMEN